MPPALRAGAESVPVCVQFENVPCQRDRLGAMYTYEKNPTISFIKPHRSFLRWATLEDPSRVCCAPADPLL